MKKYDHKKIEKKWQERWEKDKVSKIDKDDRTKEKYYILDMFPYPSGEGLHLGHTESYAASDVFYRYKKMRGYNVLHPQGFDSFGLPTENYAIKTGIPPVKTTKKNIETYTKQMKSLGLNYDFDEKIDTSEPEYYKWTQWLFGEFYKNGLVYKKTSPINWCPSCQTGIANEQVLGGECERCGTEIIQKEIPGWFFKITDFADDLINDLDKVDWPEHTKKNQINWIGKSEGALIKFPIKDLEKEISVFTTRPDTLFGATYMVLAPEHPLVASLLKTINHKSQITNIEEVEKYIKETQKKTEMERIEGKKKTGVEIKGIKAINPVNKEEIPIFIADYVLGGYGTGAIMAVPAHDERDFEFTQTVITSETREPSENFIKNVIKPNSLNDLKKYLEFLEYGETEKEKLNEYLMLVLAGKRLYTGNGIMVNSGKFDGMASEEAKQKITEFAGGKSSSNYRLRDWSISRQRYWGCPIPIVYSPDGEANLIPEKYLPWKLPEDVGFKPTGISPLADSKELKERTEKIFGKGWVPEYDTMDTFVDSSWYFLRYPDAHNLKEFCSKARQKYWLPVDLYIGGAEHTYMHLLFARFFVKAMKKIGLLDFGEPFLKLRHQGMVLDARGRKMSKSKGNVINPDKLVEKFGADAVRIQILFAAPLADDIVWNKDNIVGVYRFLEKVWEIGAAEKNESSAAVKNILQKTIKKVGQDIENLKYNTAVSEMMKFINAVKKSKISRADFEMFLKILAPFAPHLTEEIWYSLRGTRTTNADDTRTNAEIESIHLEKWPDYDEKLIKDKTHTIAVQINGKIRAEIEIEDGLSDEEVKEMALSDKRVQKWMDGKSSKKIIYVKNKILSIVV
ncbi:MAG: leucine--tRNA ligase [Candidatus Pacebacteria bacterium]|nr:leucine--tRNA ligase [Candidatus Paceibacterota bacterium]